jgi:hypothetical protein
MTDTLSEPLANITQYTSRVTVQISETLNFTVKYPPVKISVSVQTTAPQGGFIAM